MIASKLPWTDSCLGSGSSRVPPRDCRSADHHANSRPNSDIGEAPAGTAYWALSRAPLYDLLAYTCSGLHSTAEWSVAGHPRRVVSKPEPPWLSLDSSVTYEYFMSLPLLQSEFHGILVSTDPDQKECGAIAQTRTVASNRHPALRYWQPHNWHITFSQV